MLIEIYTDGSCRPNPGNGTGAFIVLDNKKKIYETSFRENNTTNNRMEMLAVINALQWCEENTQKTDKVSIHLDADYVYKGVTNWMYRWSKAEFRRDNGRSQLGDVPNKDLWQIMYKLVMGNISIKFIKVKGHSNNKRNTYVDKLCTITYQ